MLVELDDVTFAYQHGTPVLSEASFRFEGSRTHAISGPSGCGKSTLLYLAGLMLRPSAGAVCIGGVDYARAMDSTRAHARAELIGFVFQDALLDTSLTVWENVVEGLPWRSRRRNHLVRCNEGLERLGLTALRDRGAAMLSGGQAQRVALVRALAKQPSVLLADEPTGNLDPASAKVVLDELIDFGRQPDQVTIIVTHDPSVVGLCDRSVQLSALPTLAGTPG